MEDEIKLEKMKFVVLNYLTKELWEDSIVLNEPALQIIKEISEEMGEEIVMRLTCKFYTHGEGEYQFEWYKSWWQELRNKILPKWWLVRYPSIMETKETVKCMAVYPSIKIGDMEHKAIIQFT